MKYEELEWVEYERPGSGTRTMIRHFGVGFILRQMAVGGLRHFAQEEEYQRKFGKLEESCYDLTEISDYASESLSNGNYNGAYTEYRVKKLYEGE